MNNGNWPAPMRIDAHHHFWQYDPVRHDWISEEMQAIRRNFLPADLKPLLDKAQIDGTVYVQVDQTEAETNWMLEHADQHDFIQGVVGWVDLQSRDVEDRLAYFSQFPKLKGFRHIVQGESDKRFLLRPAFMKGIGFLSKFQFTYDILVYPEHLPVVKDFVKKFPDQLFVLDHLAKPFIRKGELQPWQNDIKALAAFDNVCCKVSGMVTEADWKLWKPGDLAPYLQTVLDCFGPGRLLYGSDWPVCLVAASYEKQLRVVDDFISGFSIHEREAIMGHNAMRFYHL